VQLARGDAPAPGCIILWRFQQASDLSRVYCLSRHKTQRAVANLARRACLREVARHSGPENALDCCLIGAAGDDRATDTGSQARRTDEDLDPAAPA